MSAEQTETKDGSISFYDRPGVVVDQIQIGEGVPIGIERVSNPRVGVGGAYGGWGKVYDNGNLTELVEERMGRPLEDGKRLNLSELGFDHRHHIPLLSDEDHYKVEVEIGTRYLSAAIEACGWQPDEVDAVLIGMSGPASDDYCEQISQKAGIPAKALKMSIHKACDSSVAGLNMALNPKMGLLQSLNRNLAEELRGKKVLVGGIEGLSRFMMRTHDSNAIQLFGNGAGVIGIVPGESMRFLAGASREAFDEEGMLQVRMYYPHSRERLPGQSLTEISQSGAHHIRVAGLMHEPESGDPVVMAGLMGMVKLFVRSGVQTVIEAYQAYQRRLVELGMPGKELAVAIVHHANYKINQLIEKNLYKEGISNPNAVVAQRFRQCERGFEYDRLFTEAALAQPGRSCLDRWFWSRDVLRCAGSGDGRVEQ